MRIAGVIFVALSLLGVAGCADTSSLAPGQGGTVLIVRGKTYDQVWNASVKSVTHSLTIVESTKETGVIKAEKSPGLTTWGEVAGVFITPPGKASPKYRIEVQSLKRLRPQITGQDWEKTIVEGIKAELNM